MPTEPRRPPWDIYNEEMSPLCFGHALWEPSPTNFQEVQPGDVGYIRDGRFHRLFSVGSATPPLNSLDIGEIFKSESRMPGAHTPSKERTRVVSTRPPEPPAAFLDSDTSIRFQFAESRGAALVTKYPIYREDVRKMDAFKKHMKANYSSWMELVQSEELGDVNPILVTGADKTRDYAIMCYSNFTGGLPECTFRVTPSNLGWGVWESEYSPHWKLGPQPCEPPSSLPSVGLARATNYGPGAGLQGYTQCVFIRYYYVHRRSLWLPMVIRAAAGPHDLGTGGNSGGGSQSGVQCQPGDSSSLLESTLYEDGSEFCPVIHNPTTDGWNQFGALVDYVFENSNAEYALLHHDDLALLREPGESGGLSPEKLNKLQIAVDENGVGTIVHPTDTSAKTRPECTVVHPPSPMLNLQTIRPGDAPDSSFAVPCDVRSSEQEGTNVHDAVAVSVSQRACDRLARRKFAPHEFTSLIEWILWTKGGAEAISFLPPDEAQALIDVIHETLHTSNISRQTRKNGLRLLYRIFYSHNLLPKDLTVPVSYDRSREALFRGGHANVWKGQCRGQDVAVKVIRSYSNSPLKEIAHRFCDEIVAWSLLQHPNVLQPTGVTVSENQFAIISDWMKNGDIKEFVKANPEVDRLALLTEVTEGLLYLHNNEIIHGDLKGANILVDEAGHARLADFGLLTIISDSADLFPSSSFSGPVSTFRWMSPELILPYEYGFANLSRPTKPSDCYALGMVMYETVSGKLPFHEFADASVLTKVVNGEHPTRIVEFSDDLWKIMKQCWLPNPGERPSIESVLQQLREFSNPLPGAGG